MSPRTRLSTSPINLGVRLKGPLSKTLFLHTLSLNNLSLRFFWTIPAPLEASPFLPWFVSTLQFLLEPSQGTLQDPWHILGWVFIGLDPRSLDPINIWVWVVSNHPLTRSLVARVRDTERFVSVHSRLPTPVGIRTSPVTGEKPHSRVESRQKTNR